MPSLKTTWINNHGTSRSSCIPSIAYTFFIVFIFNIVEILYTFCLEICNVYLEGKQQLCFEQLLNIAIECPCGQPSVFTWYRNVNTSSVWGIYRDTNKVRPIILTFYVVTFSSCMGNSIHIESTYRCVLGPGPKSK